ncbi:MAG TPA: CYTH and CHAD domain-containing protein [Actinomycetes bacterium]|nr:CYTH and CHAD domain-containing protein [Actinomycetes bacterium]
MQEREAKLSVSPDLKLPDLSDPADGVVAGPRGSRQLWTTYYDTPDLRLARWGLSLRYRSSAGWTVKLAGEGRGPMLVWEERVFQAPANRPPSEALDLLRAFVRDSSLGPVARLRTTRQTIELLDRDGARLGEVTDDRVAVLDGRRVSRRFRELETELAADAPDGALDGVIERLRAAGAEPVQVVSKYLQALGDPDPGPPEVPLKDLDGRATVQELVRHDLSAAVLRLFRHDPIVRLGADPEGVHQARVAMRRFRSSLRTFRPVLEEGWAVRLREQAKWLADRLGAARDADVLQARLRAHLERLGEPDVQGGDWLLRRLDRQRKTARAAVLAAMRESAYLQLLDDLIAAANSPMVLGGGRSAAEALAPRVARTWQRLRDEVAQAGPEPPDEQLHRIRIRAKRCRYAAEAVTPVVGKPAARFAAAVEAIQEILGDHHDAVVAQEWLRKAAAEAPSDAAMAAGLLIAMERDAATRSRAAWQTAWANLDRKKLRTWF